MNRGRRQTLLLSVVSILILMPLSLLACGQSTHYPPKNDTPEPPPHIGVFVSEHGTMSFNGDGSRISVDFSDELTKAMGMTTGQGTGTYVFKWYNGKYRYDDAEEFSLFIDGQHISFTTMYRQTDADTISLMSPLDGEESLVFELAD